MNHLNLVNAYVCFLSEEELVDTLLDQLTKYKNKEVKREQVQMQTMLLLVKWDQNGKDLASILKESQEKAKVIDMAMEMKDMLDNEDNTKKEKEE